MKRVTIEVVKPVKLFVLCGTLLLQWIRFTELVRYKATSLSLSTLYLFRLSQTVKQRAFCTRRMYAPGGCTWMTGSI